MFYGLAGKDVGKIRLSAPSFGLQVSGVGAAVLSSALPSLYTTTLIGQETGLLKINDLLTVGNMPRLFSLLRIRIQ